MKTQNSNSSFPLFPSVEPATSRCRLSGFAPVSSSELATINFQPSTSPNHFWRTEPAPHVDPALAKRSPWHTVQHVFCRRDTGELVGIIRRFPSQFKTAWFSGNGVTVKRHYTFQSAKKFLERQFTRTVPSGSVWKTEHAHVAPQHPCKDGTRFNIIAFPTLPHRPCAGAQVIQVNFSPRSRFKPRILK